MAIRPKQLSTAEAFITLMNDELLGLYKAFPAEITAVNTDNGALISVDVLPLIQQTISQENTNSLIYRNLPIIPDVPVVFPFATVSGFSVTVPVEVGGQVLVVIADRSIDEWQSSGASGRPVESTTPRKHDLTDAIAILGISCDVHNVSNYDFDKVCIRNADKTQRVCVSNSHVEIVSGDSNIVIDNGAITQESTTISINGSSTVALEGDTVMLTSGANSISVSSGGISVNGPVTFTGDVTINGVDFDDFNANYNSHFHNAPGGNTGGPLN